MIPYDTPTQRSGQLMKQSKVRSGSFSWFQIPKLYEQFFVYFGVFYIHSCLLHHGFEV